jgi:TatA/E family protein of Tat protein translocase
MIGPLEIAIVVVVLLVIFGYRYLPTIGRKAGTGARELKEGAQELIGDKTDPKTLARSAGKGVREAREFRDALMGKEPPEAEKTSEPAKAPEPEPARAPEPDSQQEPEPDSPPKA